MYACIISISKKRFLKNICSGTQCGGFQFLLILDLLGIRFHVVVIFGLGKNLLFKSVLGHCALKQEIRTLIKLQENTWTGSKLQTRQDCFSLNC